LPLRCTWGGFQRGMRWVVRIGLGAGVRRSAIGGGLGWLLEARSALYWKLWRIFFRDHDSPVSARARCWSHAPPAALTQGLPHAHVIPVRSEHLSCRLSCWCLKKALFGVFWFHRRGPGWIEQATPRWPISC